MGLNKWGWPQGAAGDALQVFDIRLKAGAEPGKERMLTPCVIMWGRYRKESGRLTLLKEKRAFLASGTNTTISSSMLTGIGSVAYVPGFAVGGEPGCRQIGMAMSERESLRSA